MHTEIEMDNRDDRESSHKIKKTWEGRVQIGWKSVTVKERATETQIKESRGCHRVDKKKAERHIMKSR